MAVSLKWRAVAGSGASPIDDSEEVTDALQRLEAEDAEELMQFSTRSSLGLHAEQISALGGLKGCLACGHSELFTQRDFSRGLGLAIVVLAAVFAPATHYLSLAAAALLDFLLYHTSRKVVVCYVCEAEHRGFPEAPRHPGFDREIEERLRYGAKAVMGKPMRSGGTADGPEPEH